MPVIDSVSPIIEVSADGDVGAGAVAPLNAGEGFAPGTTGYDSVGPNLFNGNFNFGDVIYSKGSGNLFFIQQGTLGLCAVVVNPGGGGSIIGAGFKYIVFPPGFNNVPTNAFTDLATAINAATVIDANTPVGILLAPGTHPVAAMLAIPSGVQLVGLAGDPAQVVVTSADATATLQAVQGQQSFSNLTVANTGAGASVRCTNIAGGHSLTFDNASLTQALHASDPLVSLTLVARNTSVLSDVSATAGAISIAYSIAQDVGMAAAGGTINLYASRCRDIASAGSVGLEQASVVRGCTAGSANIVASTVTQALTTTAGVITLDRAIVQGTTNCSASITGSNSEVASVNCAGNLELNQTLIRGQLATGALNTLNDCVLIATDRHQFTGAFSSQVRNCVFVTTPGALLPGLIDLGAGHTGIFDECQFSVFGAGATHAITGPVGSIAIFSGSIGGNIYTVAAAVTKTGIARVVADAVIAAPIAGAVTWNSIGGNPGTVLATPAAGLPVDALILPDPREQIPGRRVVAKNVSAVLGMNVSTPFGTVEGAASIIIGPNNYRSFVTDCTNWYVD